MGDARWPRSRQNPGNQTPIYSPVNLREKLREFSHADLRSRRFASWINGIQVHTDANASPKKQGQAFRLAETQHTLTWALIERSQKPGYHPRF
jgi:hypothetical protein